MTKAATARFSARLLAATACTGIPMYSSDDMVQRNTWLAVCLGSIEVCHMPFMASHEACSFSTSVKHRRLCSLCPVVIGQSDCRCGVLKLVLPASVTCDLPEQY